MLSDSSATPVPELPDVDVYVAALARRVVGEPLARLRVQSMFVLRTVDPPARELEGKRVVGVRRVGKRVVLGFEEDLFAAIHLMLLGRLKWLKPDASVPRAALAAFVFPAGTLALTESGSKHRAALHLVRGEAAVRALDAGGVEPLEASEEAFASALRRENHTLKRALTDPRVLAGIGNAYSDEILHRAGMSPTQLTKNLDDDDVRRLHRATRETLQEWSDRLRAEAGDGWPKDVTAFRKEMAVHGKFGEPCPVCATTVQRIVRGESESNYCPRCQTSGKMLSDRALAKLLHDDWPKTIDEWEERMGR